MYVSPCSAPQFVAKSNILMLQFKDQNATNSFEKPDPVTHIATQTNTC